MIYKQAKVKLEKLVKHSNKILEIMEGKCSMLWTGVLTDLWDEIDHSNQITSRNFHEHMSDYHGLEDGCDCFSEIGDAIAREIVRLLLHVSLSVTTKSECTSVINSGEPLGKKRKLE